MRWAKYGEGTTFEFPMVKRGVVDLAQNADWTPASGDSAVDKDHAGFADTTNTVAIGLGSPSRGVSNWTLALTGLELQCAEANVQIVDASTKAVEDQTFVVHTWGHANAKDKRDWHPHQAPRVAENTDTAISSALTTHTVLLPVATVEHGDLLIVIGAYEGAPTGIATPNGWSLLDGPTSNGTAITLAIFWRRCDGTEASTTVNFSTTSTCRAAFRVLRIKRGNWYGDFDIGISAQVGTAATGTSVSPDPPAVTTPWKGINSLYIAIAANPSGTASAYPTNYVDGAEINATGAILDVAYRTNAVASENPAVFTIGSSLAWVAQTLCIRPAMPDAGVTVSRVKRNMAFNNFEFLMTDSTTHAPVTGKTVTVTRSIDGGTFAAGSLSAVTEVSNGIYAVNFAASDLNGGVVTLRATATGCDDTLERIITQP